MMCGWKEICPEEASVWNSRLLSWRADHRQFPYWNEQFRTRVSRPRYLLYGERAYVCVLEFGFPLARVGVVQFGPVMLGEESVSTGMYEDLIHWASRHGFIFIRILDRSLEAATRHPRSSSFRSSFPFYEAPSRELIVNQLPQDDQMLMSFQKIARQEIKHAADHGYDIIASRDSADLRRVWHLFEEHSARKHFRYGPLEKYASMMDRGRSEQLVTLYVASTDGHPVSAALLCRGSVTAYYLLGALDIEALGDAPSPSCLLHWTAMRDCRRLGVTDYNLGTPSRAYTFKRKFRPEERRLPAPVSLPCSRLTFQAWKAAIAVYNNCKPLLAKRRA
jgi:hypothetical protein